MNLKQPQIVTLCGNNVIEVVINKISIFILSQANLFCVGRNKPELIVDFNQSF